MNMTTSGTSGESLKARIHHVSMLVENIDTYLENSFWCLQSPIVYDPIQKCRLCLVSMQADNDHLVELIEPVGENSPVYQALIRGEKLQHLCLEMPTRRDVDAFIREYRLLPVTDWEPAELFQGRLIRFAYTRNRELMEFVTHERSEE
jgi:methylmalonyl-CoA/ethylmalonyl-CoA epimerase